jgi:hypothetical protein
MRRALLLALIVGLAAAGSAAAGVRPNKATASFSQPVQLFGNVVTARVSVVTDSKRVDPARLAVIAKFAPYEPVGPPQEAHSGSGHYVQTTWTWKLRCLTAACVPVTPPSEVYHSFHFPPVEIRGFGADGKTTYRAHAFFPQLEIVSQLSPREKAYIKSRQHIQWMYQLTPAAGDAYRVAPGLVFWLAVALACLCAAAALFVGGRWALRLRQPLPSAAPAVPGSYLERALALFFWANERGDETLQRKALERVADELPLDVLDLSETARALAWSPETPEGDEVEAISQRAGVPMHLEENGKGE